MDIWDEHGEWNEHDQCTIARIDGAKLFLKLH